MMEVHFTLLLHILLLSPPGVAIPVRTTETDMDEEKKKSPTQIGLSIFSASRVTHRVPGLKT
jgi:hypothetical protein